jgi:hypothetical protein
MFYLMPVLGIAANVLFAHIAVDQDGRIRSCGVVDYVNSDVFGYDADGTFAWKSADHTLTCDGEAIQTRHYTDEALDLAAP